MEELIFSNVGGGEYILGILTSIIDVADGALPGPVTCSVAGQVCNNTFGFAAAEILTEEELDVAPEGYKYVKYNAPSELSARISAYLALQYIKGAGLPYPANVGEPDTVVFEPLG